MTQYSEVINDGKTVSIQRVNDDGSISFIPLNEENSDYQRYLNPEAEQSTPIVTANE
jgi:hypothetical protein